MKSLIRQGHRLWQKLPAAPRQRFYEALTLALAPKPDPRGAQASSWEPPYIVAGALSAPTGLGESARLLLKGLQGLGLEVYGIDLSTRLMQPSTLEMQCAKPPATGPGTIILVVQPPNVGSALSALGGGLLAHKRVVGHWVWDLQEVPGNWLKSLAYVHDLAAPSRFCADIFARAFGRRVSVLSYPVAMDLPDGNGERSGPITFGAAFDLGSTSARKNPMAALEAFERAFAPGDDRVRFEIKVRGEDADPATYEAIAARTEAYGQAISLTTGNLSPDELNAWWKRIDIFVNLHRSEGFGLLVAEAMLRKIPVIATDWAATSEYLDIRGGWPVGFDMIPVEDETGKYVSATTQWANARVGEAANAMQAAVAGGRAPIEEKGRDAAEAVKRAFSLDTFAEQLRRASGDG